MSMSWAEDDADSADESWLTGRGLISIWLIGLAFFVLLPFCATSSRRKTCWRRVKQARWDVEPIEEEESIWYRVARERYEAARQEREERENRTQEISRERQEEIRQIYLMDQISQFSKTLCESDFRNRESSLTENKSVVEDIETGKNLQSQEPIIDKNDVTETDAVDEFGNTNNVISVPAAGAFNTSTQVELSKRDVPSGCAICLCEFEEGETVTWAANKECHHVFHGECITKWLLAVGRKKKRRVEDDDTNRDTDPVKEATNFPMLCPCCRQDFVLSPQDDVKSEKEDQELVEENS